jgi:PAS domain S-box-containing protein
MRGTPGDGRPPELAETLLRTILERACTVARAGHATFASWRPDDRSMVVMGSAGTLTHPEVTRTGATLAGAELGYDLPRRTRADVEPIVVDADAATPGIRRFLARVGAGGFASVPVADAAGGLWLIELFFAGACGELAEEALAELRQLGQLAVAVVAHDAMAEVAGESAQRWRLLVEQIPAITYITDERGNTIYSSPQVETLLGLRPEDWDIDYDAWLELVHPSDRELVRTAFRGIRGTGGYVTEYRIVTPDGRVHWFADQAVYVPGEEGRPDQIHGVMIDVTARKRAEEALSISERRRQQLLSEMLRAEETERRRIAEELHDDTIQVMTAALLQIDRLLGEDGRGRAGADAVLSQLRGTIADAVERTRRMTFRLRPPLLEAQGLEAAISVLAEHLREGSGTAIEVDVRTGRIGSGIEELAFRTVQEALINAARHASAATARVRIAAEGGVLVGSVIDDGVGFDLAEALERSRVRMHLGLEAMRERVHLAGGELAIDTEPGAGTAVRFRLPLPHG